MTGRKLCLAGIALVFVLAGCDTAPPVPPDIRDADAKLLRQVEAQWSQAMSSRDPERIAANYADDATFLMPGKPLITGKPNITSELKTYFSDKAATIVFSTNRVMVSRNSDMAYSQGYYEATQTIPKAKKVVSEKGKYVAVYTKQQDGNWKAVAVSTAPDGPLVPARDKASK